MTLKNLKQFRDNPEKLQEHLNKPPDLFEVEGSKLALNLHPGQSRAWVSPARIVAIIAGTQGGKTSFGPWWLHREIMDKGSGDYIAATATFDLFKLKMLPELKLVFEHTLGIARYWSGDKVMEIRDPETGEFWANRSDDPMWSRIILRSASSEGGLESTSGKAAWLDEAGMDDFTLGAFEAVLRRLALARGRILITTTPYNVGWLKTEILDPWEQGDETIEVVNFASNMNPKFPQEEMEERELKMDTWKFRMFYLGLITKPAGLIFSMFVALDRDQVDEDGNPGHLVDDFDIPKEWVRYVAVDPGAVNQCVLWFAQDPVSEEYFLYRESLDGNKSTAEHVKNALQYVNQGERVKSWYIGNKSETQQRLDWSRNGARPVREPPFHDVEAGIDAIIEFLKTYRLYIFKSCRGTIAQFGSYRRKLDARDQPIKDILNKNAYHYIDGVRYFVVGRKGKRGKPARIRSLSKGTRHGNVKTKEPDREPDRPDWG